MIKFTLLFTTLFLLTSLDFAQLIVKDQEVSPNTLLQVNDEGTAGSITIPSLSTIVTNTNKLYNLNGSLYWNGNVLTTGQNGATQINELSDAKFDGSSLFLGSGAGANDDGTYNANTAIGLNSLYSNTTGHHNTANGYYALYSNKGGWSNTANGCNALYSNTTGYGNVALGYYAGYYEIGNNKLYIDNSSTSSPLIWGDFANNQVVINGNASSNSNNRTFFSNGQAGGTTAWFNDSDRRLKKNISTIENALEKVNKLRGVKYKWKDSKTHSAGLQMGFIAQEAEKVIPEVVDNSGDYYSMQYAPVTALLVEAIKEQNKEFRSQNKEFRNQNTEFRSQNTELKARIKKLEKENETLKTVVSENRYLRNEIKNIKEVLNKLVQQKPVIKVTKK